MLGLYRSGNWNENNAKTLSRTNWRASLVPAAAVIPAPVAYTVSVAVKKLVVGLGSIGIPCALDWGVPCEKLVCVTQSGEGR